METTALHCFVQNSGEQLNEHIEEVRIMDYIMNPVAAGWVPTEQQPVCPPNCWAEVAQGQPVCPPWDCGCVMAVVCILDG
jgi:hypothetical protein